MAITSLKLIDGAREMILLPRQSQGVFVQALEVPSPAIREVTEERTDDDGEDDTTMLFGARAVSVELLVTRDAAVFEDELSLWLHPRLRPYLVAVDDGWGQARRMRLRVSQFGGPRGVNLAPDQRRIHAQWRAPDGVWESADLVEVPQISADMPVSVGLELPVTLPVALASTMGAGTQIVTNPGSVPSHVVARLYGPCTAPQLINSTTGEVLAFTNALTLGAGEYVEVDTRARTAKLDGTADRLHMVDFTATSWWRIEPGDNEIRYAPSSATAGAAAFIDYRPAWL